MVATEAVQIAPFEQWADGSIRITGTRLHLYLVLRRYKQGASALEIAESFPAISLEETQSVIAYYLSHQAELDAYLQQGDEQEAAFMKQLEADPKYQADRAEFRERLMRRKEEMQKTGAWAGQVS